MQNCTCSPVQVLEVVHEIVGVVRAREGDLKGLVAGNEGSQTSETLLARAPNAHQQSIASVRANDARDLDKMDHGILEEDQIHA